MENILRIQINALCLLVLAVISPAFERRSSGSSPDVRAFRLLVASTAAMLAFDAVAWALKGVPGPIAKVALYAANGLYFCVHTLPTVLYIIYADYQVNRDPARSARLAKPLAALSIAAAALAASTPFTGLLFRIDEGNRYVRGPAFAAFAAFLFALVLFSLVIVLAGARKVRPGVFWTLVLYPVAIAAAALVQDLFYGLVLVWPATTVFIVAAAVNIQRRRATTDHLTGAANRRSLDEELERLVGNGRPARPLGGILLDLDDFKSINDLHGHEAGDRALEDAAAILRQSVRQEDVVARYGGDEFVILLPDAVADALGEVVKRVRARTEAHNASTGRPYRLAFSVGAALYDPEADGSADRFLSRLDAAMYADKAARRGPSAAGRR
jgi:diguanylate cyclase (GGDEF)-like protein